MNIRRLAAALSAAAALTLIFAASAAGARHDQALPWPPPAAEDRRWYAGGGLAYVWLEDGTVGERDARRLKDETEAFEDADTTGMRLEMDDAAALKGWFGYRLNESLAFEGSTLFGQTDYTLHFMDEEGERDQHSGELGFWNLSAAVVGKLSLDESFMPFAKFSVGYAGGAARVDGEDEDIEIIKDGVSASVGLGFDAQAAERLSIRAEAEWFVGLAKTASVGVAYSW